jgi:hypothetical protein
MATPRRHYHIDVTLTPWRPEGHATLLRRQPGALPWCWCPHHVRATSVARAHAKALAAHQQSTACQALDAEARHLMDEGYLLILQS